MGLTGLSSSSAAAPIGVQYRRSSSPIGVPGPALYSASFCSLLSKGGRLLFVGHDFVAGRVQGRVERLHGARLAGVDKHRIVDLEHGRAVKIGLDPTHSAAVARDLIPILVS